MKKTLLLCGLVSGLIPITQSPGESFPQITDVCTVAPNIISLRLIGGKVDYGRQTPYQAQAGDTQSVWKIYGSPFLTRDGKDIGALVGVQADILMPFDRLESVSLDPALLDAPDNYTLRSASDSNFKIPRHPVAVYRKTRPVDIVRTGRREFDALVEHRIYLKLEYAVMGARSYEISFADDRLVDFEWRHDPFHTESEAIHVNQIGFHPDDEVKHIPTRPIFLFD